MSKEISYHPKTVSLKGRAWLREGVSMRSGKSSFLYQWEGHNINMYESLAILQEMGQGLHIITQPIFISALKKKKQVSSLSSSSFQNSAKAPRILKGVPCPQRTKTSTIMPFIIFTLANFRYLAVIGKHYYFLNTHTHN